MSCCRCGRYFRYSVRGLIRHVCRTCYGTSCRLVSSSHNRRTNSRFWFINIWFDHNQRCDWCYKIVLQRKIGGFVYKKTLCEHIRGVHFSQEQLFDCEISPEPMHNAGNAIQCLCTGQRWFCDIYNCFGQR